MTLNGEMALILRYFTEFGSFRISGVHCVTVFNKAITMDNLRLLCLVVNVCFFITAKLKFGSRFINSCNAQYLPSFRIDGK